MRKIIAETTATVTLNAVEYCEVIQALELRIHDCEAKLRDTDDQLWIQQLTDDLVFLKSAREKIIAAFTADTH